MDGLLSLRWQRALPVDSVHRVGTLDESTDSESRKRERNRKRPPSESVTSEEVPEKEVRHVVDLTL